MTDATGFLRLMSWLSPVFPTGGFAYSSGLEAAVQTGIVTDAGQLSEWLSSLLQYGSLRNDGLLLAHAFNTFDKPAALNETAELALALAGSAERYLEASAQGDAFTLGVRNWPQMAQTHFPQPCSLSVAVGIAAGQSALDLRQTLNAYLHSIVSNYLQASIRLSVIGQSAAANILAELEPVIASAADWASSASLEDLGSATVVADVMSMKHEELSGRMFRS